MADGKSGRVPTIEEVVSRFEQWRQTRQGKAHIPDELWSAAVELARREGVNRTAAALHLDGGKLKRRMVAAGAVTGKAAPPAFVEFMAPAGDRHARAHDWKAATAGHATGNGAVFGILIRTSRVLAVPQWNTSGAAMV